MRILYLVLFLVTSIAQAAPRALSEKDLLVLSKQNAPALAEIRATLLSSQNEKNILEEKYAPELFGRASYAENQERPIIEFIPIFSPVKQASVGVRKKFSKGFETQLLASTDQRSANSAVAGTFDNVTTNVLSFTMQMDLWRDLFGRVSEAERMNAGLESKRAALEEEIRTRAFEISLRRIYWSLVATEEQLKISERLKKTAFEQVADSKKRLQNSIGDSGEVARYEAQVASRSGQVIYLGYQKQNLLKQLKNLLPDLGLDEISLAPYDIDSTIQKVAACSMVITRENKIPYNFTKYDEVLQIIRDIKSNRRAINERYSDVDVKLFGTVKSTGVGSDQLGTSNYRGSYGDAYKDMKNNNRTGYEAGVNVSIPLGDSLEKTKETKALYDEMRLKALMDQTDSQVVSTHTQLAKSMALINEVILTQRAGTKALEKRLSVIRKKYSQARISVNDLILDQDALMSSEISTIDAQLQAVNVLFDYLMVFTDTPCEFNRI